ncbi:MAG: nuclear transport factor 2 family protein [Actinomycetota bacterium]
MSDLEARIQRLEHIEAIKQLKAEYCAACDDGYDPDRLAALFTGDAVWDGGNTFGVCDGRAAIHAHFTGASRRVTIARHQVMNPIIEVDGDTATGQWLLFQPCTNSVGGEVEAVWLAATYHDRYERVAGRWLIARTEIDVAFFTPFDQGWAEQRFLPGREP